MFGDMEGSFEAQLNYYLMLLATPQTPVLGFTSSIRLSIVSLAS